jgi:aryl-alcohol dehydrogenase-like predicted oxidoreductase
VLPAARAFGLGIIPYLPLASGFLSGKYREGVVPPGARLADSPNAADILTAANFARLERLETFARERGHSIVDLAIGWLLGHPEVGSVIAGASGPDQVVENVKAAAWRLDASEMSAVAAL